MGDRKHNDITKEFYERHAEEYVENTREMLDMEWLEKFTELLPGTRVLDVGTAGGRDAMWFRSRGLEVVGIDYSPKMIVLAEAAASEKGIDFRVDDVRELSFNDNSFDGAWCSCVLIHLPKHEIPTALKELSRVLKPGGLLYVLVKIGTTEGIEKDSRYRDAPKFASYFTEDELATFLHEAGFTIREMADIDKEVDEYRAKDRLFFLAINRQ